MQPPSGEEATRGGKRSGTHHLHSDCIQRFKRPLIPHEIQRRVKKTRPTSALIKQPVKTSVKIGDVRLGKVPVLFFLRILYLAEKKKGIT